MEIYFSQNKSMEEGISVKKVSVTVFKLLFIGIFLFFSTSVAFGGLPLEGVVSKVLKDSLGNLRINTERLSPDEIKFLEDSLKQEPSWMLESKKAREAIFEGPSSKVDKAYRKLFYSRLDPYSDEEMSEFFKALEDHQLSVYDKLSKGKRPAFNPSYIKDTNRAWKRATNGILYAINNGDFNISLRDFHALFANRISEHLGVPDFFETAKKIPQILVESGRIGADELMMTEESVKFEFIILGLSDIFQATSKDTIRRTSRNNPKDHPFILIMNTLKSINVAVQDINLPQIIHVLDSPQTPKVVRNFLKSIEDMFLSPFYKPSVEAIKLLEIMAMRGPILGNENLILRLWNSGIDRYRSILKITLEGSVAAAAKKAGLSPEELSSLLTGGKVTPEKIGKVYRHLGESEFFQAISGAAQESEEITNLIQDTLEIFESELRQGSSFH